MLARRPIPLLLLATAGTTEAFVAPLPPPSCPLPASLRAFPRKPRRCGLYRRAHPGTSGTGGGGDGWTVPPPLPVTNDPYLLLGIDPALAGNLKAIKRAYHTLAKA